MKTLRVFLALFLLAAVPGSLLAQAAAPWNAPAYGLQFKYFQERPIHNNASWTALTPAEQARQLEMAKKLAAERLAAVRAYYEAGMRRWNTDAMNRYTGDTDDKNLKAAAFWLGKENAARLSLKLSTVRAMTRKAGREGLDEDDIAALTPYLNPGAIADLKAIKLAQAGAKHPQAGADPHEYDRSAAGQGLNTFATDPSALNTDTLDRFYSGKTAHGSPVDISGGERAVNKAYGAAYTAAPAAKTPRPAANIPLPAGDKAVPAGNKSSGLTSDAYGITVFVTGRQNHLTFRQGTEAAAAIRRLPNGSVNKVIFYGHGAPGLQTVGGYDVDADVAATVLKDKMAPGGVVQFSGCNTAGVGTKPSVNPLFGLSIAMRRLLYFSLPYFQDRMDGRSAAEAREFWEKEWNKDLARDTSLGVRGAVVCGYRSFGLVPGRLPGVTTLQGSQEATTPGYVAGVKACYRNGQEVPAP